MNGLLIAAGVLTIAIGIAHSVLGEWLLLGPLFAHGDVTKLLGSRTFARRTLRFTWHLTTILATGLGVVVIVLAFSPLAPTEVLVVRILAVTLLASSLISAVGARGKHFSWWVFFIISVLLWLGSST